MKREPHSKKKKPTDSDYEAKLCAATTAHPRSLHLRGRVTRILLDPDVRTFIDSALATRTFDEIVAATRDRFGSERTPSRSAISRYWRQYCRQRFHRREVKD